MYTYVLISIVKSWALLKGENNEFKSIFGLQASKNFN